ncbi:MAG: ATP-binding protein [Cyanobacteria bacterium J06638_28]
MNFSRIQYWLTGGFSVVLIALLGTAWLARRAIMERVYLFEWAGEETSGYAYFNGLLVAIAEAEIHQQNYLVTSQEEELSQYYEQLEFIRNILEELFEDYEELEPDSAYREAIENLAIATERSVELMEAQLDQAISGQLDLASQLALNRQLSEVQVELQITLTSFLEVDNTEREWAFIDINLSANNELWLWGILVSLGSIALILSYIFSVRTLSKQVTDQAELQNQNQRLSQQLRSQTTTLSQTKATLKTELDRLEEIEQAKELTDLKLNFFSLASHELRTPLSAILVSAQLLDNSKVEWTEAKRSRNLKRIQSSAKTMTQLLADILLLTRAEAGKLEFHPQKIQLHDFCEQLVEEVKFNTQAQQQIAVIYQGQSTDAYLDEKLLRALLMSLLTNAIKYSPSESEIKLLIQSDHDSVCFQIKDQGVGIAIADQQHLFESFHRGQNSKAIPGTGLGLAVVKKCLDLQNGIIEVESEVGIGTTFTVKIPWATHNANKRLLS